MNAKIEEFGEDLHKYLGSTVEQKSVKAAFIVGWILEDTGLRKLVQQIFHSLLARLDSESDLHARACWLIAGSLERQGKVNDSIKYHYRAMRSAQYESDKEMYELHWASAKAGIFKKNPLKLRTLLEWYKVVRNQESMREAEFRRYWEIGYIFHFFGEYVFDPILVFLRILLNLKNIHFFLNMFLRLPLWAPFGLIFRPCRIFFLKRALKYYSKCIDLSKVSSAQEEYLSPEYEVLALLGRSEVFSALGKFDKAQSDLKNCENFYDWIKSGHGSANVLVAKGIFDYYRNDLDAAVTLFKMALPKYGDHQAGIMKAKVYLFLSLRSTDEKLRLLKSSKSQFIYKNGVEQNSLRNNM